MGISLSLLSSPDQEARSLVSTRLDEYNRERTGIADSSALDVLAIDQTDGVVGGLVGRTSLGVLFIDYFYLPDSLRGRGLGAEILALAEAEAIRRGCSRAVLFTMTIQAPGFYEKQGYEVFGRVDCDPPGNARVFMKKDLRRTGGPAEAERSGRSACRETRG
jgi:GNAT superfamily N-acetyltransferase